MQRYFAKSVSRTVVFLVMAVISVSACGAIDIADVRSQNGYRQISFGKKSAPDEKKISSPDRDVELQYSATICNGLSAQLAQALVVAQEGERVSSYIPYLELRSILLKVSALRTQRGCASTSDWQQRIDILTDQSTQFFKKANPATGKGDK